MLLYELYWLYPIVHISENTIRLQLRVYLAKLYLNKKIFDKASLRNTRTTCLNIHLGDQVSSSSCPKSCISTKVSPMKLDYELQLLDPPKIDLGEQVSKTGLGLILKALSQ